MENSNVNLEALEAEDIKKALYSEQNTVPYRPMSKLPSLGTVTPVSLAGENIEAQSNLLRNIPDIDNYLMEKLKYSSKIALSNAFSAEQADAAAMAIYQIEKGNGFVLGDAPGIGKGRVNASVIRYAYVNGYLPIFITENPGLFTPIYRDIRDIGGLETKRNGKPYYGTPLILNGYKNGGKEKVLNEKTGEWETVQKPSETSILDANGKEFIVAPKQSEIKDILDSGKLPKAYDFVVLTYTQISGSKSADKKMAYLAGLAKGGGKKIVLCMDEVHNASGVSSTTGKNVRYLMDFVQGALFSSATFSKRPENMYLYSLRTDIATSPMGINTLIDVIKRGGEKLTENLAANLVRCGQMCRRERTYDNCNVEYEFMTESGKEELFGKYDLAIKNYKRLADFFSLKNELFGDAVKNSIDRFCAKNKIEIAEPKPTSEKDMSEWLENNLGKYIIVNKDFGEFTGNQFNFIDSLLFSLKADFVAEQVLSQLTNKSINVNVEDKAEFLSNRKPVIAVRSTLEGIFMNLGIGVGGELNKADFSLYMYSYAKSALEGYILLKKVTKDKKANAISYDHEILMSDFSDNGEQYNELVEDFSKLNLNIPISPIDYIIDKVQSVQRAGDDKYGNGNPYYTVGEVTGRKLSLKQQQNGKYKIIINPKDKNKAVTFNKFNNGIFDVLLINESGSTGADAHSSANFKDQRPRAMIIHQVELDVSTEVQKRGRINRTGMVNYPTYVYAVSRIPSEIRRLIMLSKKMRSLDANTTANQKQSSKISQIRDANGNIIEDVINKYGEDVLNDFISDPSNAEYHQYMPTDKDGNLKNILNELAIISFTRKLELASCEMQEKFYITINAAYKHKIEGLKKEDLYDLETQIINVQASIKNRVLITKGDDSNPFNESVYEEDNYIVPEDKAYTKDKIEDLKLQLSFGKDPDEFYNEFLADFDRHFNEVSLPEAVSNIALPEYPKDATEEEKALIKAKYDASVTRVVERMKSEHYEVKNCLLFPINGKETCGWDEENAKRSLSIGSNCLIPTFIDECYEKDENGIPKAVKRTNGAKFVGINLLHVANDKYSPMNIEMVFVQLEGEPKFTIKPTSRGREVIEFIRTKTVSMSAPDLVRVNAWVIDPSRRDKMRVLTGNILSAYGAAQNIVSRNGSEYSPVIKFVKFTTVEGSIRFGIRLKMYNYKEVSPDRTQVQYPAVSPTFINDLMLYNKDISYVNPDENMSFSYSSANKMVTIGIFGGISGSKSEKDTRAYYNKIYDESAYGKIFEKYGAYKYFEEVYYKPFGAAKSRKINVLQATAFIDSDRDASFCRELLWYINSKSPLMVVMVGLKDDASIVDKIDLFVEGDSSEDSSPTGTFEYSLLKPYDLIKKSLSSFSKFDKYEKDSSTYGKVTLNRRASALEATSYDLSPINSTQQDMIKDAFSLFNDTETSSFNKVISEAVKKGSSSIIIYSIVEDALRGKVLTPKNIFGKFADNLTFVGDLFRTYVEGGELEMPEMEDHKEAPLPSIPLDMESAQDYLILLKYKIQ